MKRKARIKSHRKAKTLTRDIKKIEKYNELKERVISSNCQYCPLWQYRNKIVFDRGKNNRVLALGEAPGAQESLEGKPFVGQSGKLLNSMLKEVGIDHRKIVIGNAVRCRPVNNRTPTPEEVKRCHFILKRQIQLLKPRMILFLGNTALRGAMRPEYAWMIRSVSKCAGLSLQRLFKEEYVYPEFWTPESFVIYHPAYILRNRSKKDDWLELARKFAKRCMILELDIFTE